VGFPAVRNRLFQEPCHGKSKKKYEQFQVVSTHGADAVRRNFGALIGERRRSGASCCAIPAQSTERSGAYGASSGALRRDGLGRRVGARSFRLTDAPAKQQRHA
jgi:hypothetical protein